MHSFDHVAFLHVCHRVKESKYGWILVTRCHAPLQLAFCSSDCGQHQTGLAIQLDANADKCSLSLVCATRNTNVTVLSLKPSYLPKGDSIHLGQQSVLGQSDS